MRVWLGLALVTCAAAQAAGRAPQCPSLDDVIAREPQLSRLQALVRTVRPAQRREFAAYDGAALTFFAPSDTAWDALPRDVIDVTNITRLELLFDYHTVLNQVRPTQQLTDGLALPTTLRAAPPLKIQRASDANATGAGAGAAVRVVAAMSVARVVPPGNLGTCRGVLLVIDAVLLPPQSTL